jgi:hypothetical protein
MLKYLQMAKYCLSKIWSVVFSEYSGFLLVPCLKKSNTHKGGASDRKKTHPTYQLPHSLSAVNGSIINVNEMFECNKHED